MNKQKSVLRISFRCSGHKDSRLVIKVVQGSEVLFEIEDWTYDRYHNWSIIDRYYNCSHDYIKNLEAGCHFELHYAVDGDSRSNFLEIRDFRVCVEGKLSEDKN